MGKITLKKCPFCGGIGKIVAYENGVKVICSNCFIQTPSYMDSSTVNARAVEHAIARWNDRRKISKEKEDLPF